MNTVKDNKQRTCIENKSLAVRINIEPILAEPDQGTFHSAKESWNLHPVLKLQLLPPHCPCLTQSPTVTHILGVRVKQLLKTKWPCVNKPLQEGKLTLTFSFACLLPTSKAFTPGKPRIPAGLSVLCWGWTLVYVLSAVFTLPQKSNTNEVGRVFILLSVCTAVDK